MASTAELDAMRRALVLARNGEAGGRNPRVGCVILDADGRTLAEGWHRRTGLPHAEIEALAALPRGAADGATAVVTLEPCNHHGRTGPCSVALAEAGVARVVYGVTDPGVVSGGGGDHLAASGVSVEGGVLPAENEEFLADWLVAARHGRPYVTLKWASSLDGRTAAVDGTSRWITGTAARQRVHEQRADADAILVGTGTVLADDPSLTARGDGGELLPRQPVPVIVGTRAIPADAAVLRHPRTPIVLATRDLVAALAELADRGIRSVYVEGGPTLSSALVRAGLVDEFAVYLAPVLLGGDRLATDDLGIGTIADAARLAPRSIEQLGSDLLIMATPTGAADHRNG